MSAATLMALGKVHTEEGNTSQVVEVKVGTVGSKQGTLCLSGSSGRLTGKHGLLPFNLTTPCIRDADDDDNAFKRLCWGKCKAWSHFSGLMKQELMDCVMGRGPSVMLFTYAVQAFCRNP